MPLSATYMTEDVVITYSASGMELDHYGVPGSPEWYVPKDVKVETVEIFGVDEDPSNLSDDLYSKLVEFVDEVQTWEKDDEQ